ncbi:MAG: hypothetical protein KAT37_03560, partial [Candidatus Aenigmarchaeota archaeon]|nr:hypothetical protein [Candidatus Aenigmarchaeota archaeon]
MKGLIGIALLAIMLIGIAAGAIGFKLFSTHMSQVITFEVSYNSKELMEDKLHFDSEKYFLKNSLLVAGAYAAYKNGENGTVYKDSWGRCEGFDLDGNPYSYSCWKDTTGDNIPPEYMAVDGVFNRTNETFKDYFSELEYTEIEDIEPLQMEYDRKEFNFSYNITELNLTGDFLNHTMEEKNVWINTTIPIRYLMLRGNGSDFTQNSDTRLNTDLIDVLDDVTVCTGLGQLTQGEAETAIEKELQNIA